MAMVGELSSNGSTTISKLQKIADEQKKIDKHLEVIRLIVAHEDFRKGKDPKLGCIGTLFLWKRIETEYNAYNFWMSLALRTEARAKTLLIMID
uniref:Uncharacterized protein n=1 Tax=Tanacetum cinerariifolium TaxID=118510 RepID=A0A6L2N2S8_TANCI|nr:hypothetical protein [Tanacetum cinerariifolium]